MQKIIKNIFLTFVCLISSSCVTTGSRHVPHIVDNIDQRALVISQQTHYLSPQIIVVALNAYNHAQLAGYGEKHILTIIDYSKPSNHDRFWVINLDTNQVLCRELVAHGVGSGLLYATRFSNNINSRATSIGMYMTAPRAYRGRHGYSLRLKGLEPGFNNNAWTRALVIHGATYVCKPYIDDHGYVGQSWGCPALPETDVRRVINIIQGGTLVFAYANDPNWLNNSRFLS